MEFRKIVARTEKVNRWKGVQSLLEDTPSVQVNPSTADTEACKQQLLLWQCWYVHQDCTDKTDCL